MRFINENFKFINMRKPQEFLIYPCLATDKEIKIQSDKRIALISLETGKGLISNGKHSNGFAALSRILGAIDFTVTPEDLEKLKTMHQKMSGQTLPDRSVVLVG